jgi:cytosine/uracil/thiamine/allantoin permease
MVPFAHLRPGSTGWTSGRAVRAFLVGAMSFCWALSGVWRFVPTPLAEVSTVAWVGFGAALLAYLVARAAQLTCRIARLDVRKISS